MQREGKSQSDHYFFPADFYLKADISCYTPSKCVFLQKKRDATKKAIKSDLSHLTADSSGTKYTL